MLINGTGLISRNIFDGNVTDASNGDFHVRSKNGRFIPSTGRFVKDSEYSPTIDAGNPSSGFSEEPEPNGRRINLGCYGNTVESSKSADT